MSVIYTVVIRALELEMDLRFEAAGCAGGVDKTLFPTCAQMLWAGCVDSHAGARPEELFMTDLLFLKSLLKTEHLRASSVG